jgi:hypothetical protein
VGLPAAVVGLDDQAAAEARAALEAAHRGVGLLDESELDERWTTALVAVASRPAVHGAVSGRVNRMLLDAGRIDPGEAGRRMSRRLSLGAPAGAAAAWLDGFLSGESVLLVHDPVLLGIVDDWVSGIGEDVFDDLLPLLRRTFARFPAAERRAVGERVVRRRAGPGGGREAAGGDRPRARLDLDRARPAFERVAALLGLEVDRG